jgi:hypothetical protein
VNVRIDPDAELAVILDQIAPYADAGVDLIILNLPLDAEPAILGPLADLITPLA